MHHAQLAESINVGNSAAMHTLHMLEAGGLSHAQALAVVNRLITQQAFMLSTQELFYGSALLFLALTGVIWLARRIPASDDGAGPATGAH